MDSDAPPNAVTLTRLTNSPDLNVGSKDIVWYASSTSLIPDGIESVSLNICSACCAPNALLKAGKKGDERVGSVEE